MGLLDKPEETPERPAFYNAIEQESMRALWTVMSGNITPQPNSECVPCL